MPELPTLPREPTCPAALTVTGASACERGIVCRVMQRDHEEDSGLGMSAAQSGFIQHEAIGGVYLNLKSDPATVTGFCHGSAIPVLDESDTARASYTACPVWTAEKDRIARGDDKLVAPAEPESVSMGVPEPTYSNPWRQARADLDLLAG